MNRIKSETAQEWLGRHAGFERAPAFARKQGSCNLRTPQPAFKKRGRFQFPFSHGFRSGPVWQFRATAESFHSPDPRYTAGMPVPSRALIETFPNPFPGRPYTIETVCPEFTSLCPKTGQPDFGVLTIAYIPGPRCFELKSLKLYLQEYRNHGAFYEQVTNDILDDLVAATDPKWMRIDAAFTPRGGIRTTVRVEFPDPAPPART